MTSDRKKATSNNPKAILFASLTTAIVLPFLMADIVVAEQDMYKYTLQDISDSELLKRSDTNPKFAKYMEEINGTSPWKELVAYVNAELPDNKWNKDMVKSQIRINNFDTIIENPGYGHELVALVAEKMQLGGKYGPSEPVKRYHEWAKSKHDIPHAEKMIDGRIAQITGDKKYDELVNSVYEEYNKMAEYGNVPSELLDSDIKYWTGITSDKICEFDDACNADNVGFNPHSPDCAIVQCAHAQAWSTYHPLTVKVEAYVCDANSCLFTNSDGKSGTFSVTASSQGKHAYTKSLKYYIEDRSFVGPTYNAHHNISGSATIGWTTESIGSETGINTVTMSGSKSLDMRCGSEYCGTYQIRATAQNVTFET